MLCGGIRLAVLSLLFSSGVYRVYTGTIGNANIEPKYTSIRLCIFYLLNSTHCVETVTSVQLSLLILNIA